MLDNVIYVRCIAWTCELCNKCGLYQAFIISRISRFYPRVVLLGHNVHEILACLEYQDFGVFVSNRVLFVSNGLELEQFVQTDSCDERYIP